MLEKFIFTTIFIIPNGSEIRISQWKYDRIDNFSFEFA